MQPQLVVLGSMALDDIETPYGKYKDLLGGSATYAAYAASFFSKAGIVSIIGEDFPEEHKKLLMSKGIDLKGIQISGKTFHWQGFYEEDMNVAQTICTDLNCLADFTPQTPPDYKNAKYVFLANTHPVQQMQIIQQLGDSHVIVMDTMNLWIKHTKNELIDVIKKVNILVLNDAEIRALFNTVNIVQAAREALALGPEYVIIKKGEHGAIMYSAAGHFSAPGYPLEILRDPTGCGDCFGGGLVGYLAETEDLSESNMRRAVVYGSVCASYNAEDFSLNRLKQISRKDIENRYLEFKEMVEFSAAVPSKA